jgi:hypothetical protein
MKNEANLPYWPAAMDLKSASAYCGCCPETFKKVCPVKPIAFTNSSRGHRYLRNRLDEWLLSLDPNKPGDGMRFGDEFDGAPKPKRRFGDALFGNGPVQQTRKRRRSKE